MREVDEVKYALYLHLKRATQVLINIKNDGLLCHDEWQDIVLSSMLDILDIYERQNHIGKYAS